MHRQLVFIALLIQAILHFTTTAQNSARITGTVLSGEGEALIGANVVVKETSRGSVTKLDGSFQIQGLKKGAYTVRVSMIGYGTVELKSVEASNNPKALRIELAEETYRLDQIEVQADKLRRPQDDTRISVQNLKPREAKFLPGAGEDVMRSLQALPGILSPNDFTSQLAIRGSGPDQNLIIMDGIEVFNPYRLYGAVSMFNPETVSDITLISGGFPAKYGDRLSAVLDVTYRDGRDVRPIYGNLNTSLTNLNVVVEGQLPADINGSWLLSSRRTYYDLIFGPIAKSTGIVSGDVSFPNFGDIQSKVTITPWSGHKFFATGILSRDGVDIVTLDEDDKRPDSVAVFNTTFNSVASAGWNYAPNKRTLNSILISYYNNYGSTEFDGRLLDPALNREAFKGMKSDSLKAMARLFGLSFSNTFDLQKVSIKDEFLMQLPGHTIEAGAGWDIIDAYLTLDLVIDPALKEILESNPRGSALLESTVQLQSYSKGHAYFQDRIVVADGLFVQPGLRLDYYDALQDLYLSPRINASYAYDPVTTLRAAFGIYYQSPGYEKLFDQNQFFDFSDEYLDALNAEKALHYVFGVERWIDTKWLAKVDFYYKDFSDLIVQQKTQGSHYEVLAVQGVDPKSVDAWSEPFLVAGDSITNIPVNEAVGESWGVELMVEKRNVAAGDRISGWISYAYAVAHRVRDGIVTPFNYDQRHTLNIVGNYKINSWLEAGLFWRLGSNFPYTEPVGVRPRIVVDNGEPVVATDFNGNVILDVEWGDDTRTNQAQKPFYHRLDIRFTAFSKFWKLDWAFYLDIINIYNHSNLNNYRFYIENDGSLGVRETNMIPILPTLGINARF